MAVKYILAVAVICLAVVSARNVPEGPEARSPVGKCPAKDGATPVYLADSTDCTVFYECSAGVPNKKECLPSLCFDTTLNVCAFPPDEEEYLIPAPMNAVGQCPPRDSNTTVYLPDSTNCTLYYVCSNGNAIPSACPPDMSWNTEKNTCDWDLDAHCNSNASMAVPLSAVGSCPVRDTNVTVFLPDSSNCTVYYICSNGKPNPQACVPGMAWSVKLNVCDWDNDGDCVPDSEQNGILRKSRSSYSPEGTCPPKDGQVPVYLADSEDCTLYYECSNGLAIPNVCSPGLVWNSRLNVCDFDLDEDCVADSLQKKRIQPRKPVGTCPEKEGSMPVYLPDAESCSLYYECSGGIPIMNNCPDDLEFNPKLNVCDDPLDAGCQASGSNSTTSATEPTTVPTTTSIPDPTS